MLLALLLLACGPDKDDTGDTADSGDTADTTDSGDTGVVTTPGWINIGASAEEPDAWDLYSPDGVVFDGVVRELTTGVPAGFDDLQHSWVTDGHTLVVDSETQGGLALTWKLEDNPRNDVTPPFDLAPGDAVTVYLEQACGEGCDWAFAVRDAAGIVTLADGAAWGVSVPEAAHVGLDVVRDTVLWTGDDGCGTVERYSIAFTGDQPLSLVPFDTGTVPVGGVDVQVWAVDAYDYLKMECTDLSGSFAWAAARPVKG